MTDLPHLASRLYGSPLLLARSKLDTLLGVFERKLAGLPVTTFVENSEAASSAELQIVDGIALIPVLGTLVRRSSYLNAASGLTSYHAIEAMAEDAFADHEVKAVLLEIDSGGGEAGGVFELSRRLRELSQKSGKPLWAIADEAALSAAYAIGCAADELWLTPTAEVGSVGVVAVHVDQSRRDDKEGLCYTFLHAGDHKVDGHPHAPLGPEAATDIQHDVEDLYEQFIELVASQRSLSPQALRDTQARVYRGKAALELGLADRLGNTRAALAALHRHLSPQPSLAKAAAAGPFLHPHKELSMSVQAPVSTDAPKPDPQVSDAAAAQAQSGRVVAPVAAPQPPAEISQPASAQAAVSAQASRPDEDELTARVTADVQKRLRQELAELTEIAAQAKRLGVTVDPAQALTQGITPDALRQSVLKQAAERDAAQDIVAQAPAAASAPPAESPLIAAARRMAQLHGGRTV